MGWVTLLVLAVAAGGAAWRLGLPAQLAMLLAAALTLGAAGYAWQGRPALAGHPAVAAVDAADFDPDTAALRDAMMGRFTLDAAYLVAADAMQRSGDRDAAVQVLVGGARKLPKSYMLWTALGTALARHDGGQVSPAALLAFEQAARLAPRHPAPAFFLGQAYVEAGRFAEGKRLWLRALALTPAGLSYRQDIAIRLVLLDRLLAAQAAAGR